MQNDVRYESGVIRMSGTAFLTEFIFRYAWIWILSLSLLGVAGLVIGISVDLRWLVVGLMIVLIVMPMLVAFLYYSFGLKRECFVNTIPHHVLVCDRGLTARLIVNYDSLESDAEDAGETKENKTEPRLRDEFFPYDMMQPYRIGSKSVIIPFKKPAKGFIWIPADAFADPSELASALEFIDSKIQ